MVKLGMEVVPLRVLANPVLTPVGTHMTTHREGCLSINGYTAHVPRALTVELRAYDLAQRAHVTERHSGWTARILQHEVARR